MDNECGRQMWCLEQVRDEWPAVGQQRLCLEAANLRDPGDGVAFVARGAEGIDFVVSGMFEAPCGTAGFVVR
jgi:hypothetical protein